MDEASPHIHASVVPIVQGECRKKNPKKEQETDTTKRKYKKKDQNRPRLCADDVMARNKLMEYQDSYAEAIATTESVLLNGSGKNMMSSGKR